MTTPFATGRLGDSRSTPRVTVLELLFDVVFVFAITRVAQRLTDDFTISRKALLSETGQTMLFLGALWMIWYLNAWMTSRFDPQRSDIQLVVIVTMFGSLLIAVCLPQAFGERGLIFVVTYVVIQIGRPLYLVWAMRGHPRQPPSVRILCWSVFAASLWLTGGFFEAETRGALWTIAVLIELLGPALHWRTPFLGSPGNDKWIMAEDHLAERYTQFLLIALGESVIATGIAISVRPFTTGQMTIFVASFLTTLLFWRIFFYHAGLGLAAALARARSAAGLGQSASYALLLMVAGIIIAGVGYRLVIDDPDPPMDPAWVAVIFGGPVVFLAGRLLFEYQLFGRVNPSLRGGMMALILVAPGMAFVNPMISPLVATLLLAGMAVHETLARRHERAATNPPL
ncbi:low temperature requirement protein A [Micromonospora sp. NPDC050397]|uniref:low temperature requirement protein A n=1 Tax=Micromonospora sp. NPDC050397 TaxID=3364279 RepID=UPI00384F791E